MDGFTTFPTGVVSALFVKPVRHEPMAAVDDAQLQARRGFIGDCHAQQLGPRQVLIVREEALDGLGVQAWQVRANIATRGLPESALSSGTVLRFGDSVSVRVTHECEVCKVLRRYVAGEVFRDLPGRRGSLGVILAGGVIQVGSQVTLAPERYPEVPERVYERLAWVVDRIPFGRITTYPDLLTLVGVAKPFFRVLPTYLKRADVAGLPAHRVLTSAREVTRHIVDQRARLTSEGVAVDLSGRVADGGYDWDAASLYSSRSCIRLHAP